MIDDHTQNGLTALIKDGTLQLTDPTGRLKDCIIFFAFPKSRSANLPMAIRLARAATVYGEENVAGRTLHWAGFTRSTGDLERGAELLRLAGNWKGTLTRISGKIISDGFKAYLTIACYLEARQCTSQPAHCHVVIDDPFHPDFDPLTNRLKPMLPWLAGDANGVETTADVKQYLFPCRRMLMHSLFHTQFQFEQGHPSTPSDLIQAAAVEGSIHICPFFDSTAFQETGVRRIKVFTPTDDGI